MKKVERGILLMTFSALLLCSCSGTGSSSSSSSSSLTDNSSSSLPSSSSSSSSSPLYSYREDRDFTGFVGPNDTQDSSSFIKVSQGKNASIATNGDGYSFTHGSYRLDFLKKNGKFVLSLYSLTSKKEAFVNETPVRLYIKGSSNEEFLVGYDSCTITDYGIKAEATVSSTAGSSIVITDLYYLASEDEAGSFNVSTKTEIITASSSDTGFANEYSFSSVSSSAMEWWAPGIDYKTMSSNKEVYKETCLGAPMVMMRDNEGLTLSLARYQPKVTYKNNDYATFELNKSTRSLTVAYPSNEANRKYHTLSSGAKHVYEVAIRGEDTDSFSSAMSSVYNAEFNLQDQRIVDTDIDEVYKVICEDYKTFFHSEEQEDEETHKKYTSYGLPWRITIEDGEFGPYTYQAGFIGQQLPSAYNMMLYGVMNNDKTSLQNGINIIDFWVNDAEMMSIVGVPHIWYDTWSDSFRSYPCFLRMAVDAMEGLLDAYRLATAHGIEEETWLDAINAFAGFLVDYQNDDGSYYRCYNYSGGPFVSWDDGIEEPVGDICQSTSKDCSAMPIRFLGKMYEMTSESKYLTAAKKAGEYVLENIYPLGFYRGGTCDGPNNIDKEAGVYAMYAYDTLYTLTGDSKWLDCIKQAAAFTMSTVMIFSFETKESALKAGYALQYGYNDGMSFISCSNGSGVDNYASYIYYELFRLYIFTGEKTYLKQSEFIQENTKSIMNWDGALNYKYKSLVAEASSISTFTFSSASDGAWVTWSSVANAEPIAKMYCSFGSADVMDYKDESLSDLQTSLKEVGVGGKAHKVFANDVVSSVEA